MVVSLNSRLESNKAEEKKIKRQGCTPVRRASRASRCSGSGAGYRMLATSHVEPTSSEGGF